MKLKILHKSQISAIFKDTWIKIKGEPITYEQDKSSAAGFALDMITFIKISHDFNFFHIFLLLALSRILKTVNNRRLCTIIPLQIQRWNRHRTIYFFSICRLFFQWILFLLLHSTTKNINDYLYEKDYLVCNLPNNIKLHIVQIHVVQTTKVHGHCL